jgi:APA family basic amino acid/polyamine antiporter
MDSPRSGLPRRIGVFTAGCLLVSNVVGSGIFTTTGFMARDLGDPRLILAVWFLGALLALAGALSYSELGTALPVAGGEYVYLHRAYGPLVGFLSGWTSFTVGFSAAIAAGAMGFAAYLLQIVPFLSGNGPLSTGVALALIWVVTGFHLAGVGSGGFLQRLLTILNVGAILILVVGVWIFGKGNWTQFGISAPDVTPGIGAMMVSLIFVTYAYSGWNAAAYVAGEIVDPGRNIPRAMIGGTLIVGLLYLVVNGTYLYALPITELGQAPILPVASKVAEAMLGPAGTLLVTVLLCLSIAGAVSAMVWAGPRVYYAMACDGVIPACFSETAGLSGTPLNAIVLQSLWASVLILSGTFERLIIYSGVVLAIFSALAVGSVMVLRRRNPEWARPYRVPLYPLVPLCYVVLSVTIAIYGLIERPIEGWLGIATVIAGVPLYVLWTQMRGRQRN